MQILVSIKVSQATLLEAIQEGKLHLTIDATDAMPNYTDAEVATFYGSGDSAREVARKHGRSYNYFLRRWKQLGLSVYAQPKDRKKYADLWLAKQNAH